MVKLRYQLAVRRNTLTNDAFNTVAIPDNAGSQEEALEALIRAPAPQPTPRFSGNVCAIEALLDKRRARPREGAIVETQDMNVVAAAKHPDRSSIECDGDADLQKLLELLRRPEARSIQFRPMKPFERLNITPGKAGAASRLAAVKNHSFHMYPSAEEGSEDAFEVRFIEPGGVTLRFERFLEYGVAELQEYITRAVKLGNVKRLKVEALAEADPVVFWACVYRYRTVFKTLSRVSGDRSWAESFRDAVHAGAAKAATKFGPKGEMCEENSTFVKLPAELNEKTHRELSHTGFMAGITLVLSMGKVKPGSGRKRIEISDGMRATRLGKAVQLAMDGGIAQKNAASEEERQQAAADMEARLRDLDPNENSSSGGLAPLPDTIIRGQRSLCTTCGKKEEVRNMYKRCGRCKAPHIKYCDRQCQSKDWNDGHKKICGKGGAKRPHDGAVEVVIFPGDADLKPYATWVPGKTHAEHVQFISDKLLKCEASERTADMTTLRAEQGKPEDVGNVLLIHRRSPRGEPNMRACCVATEGMSEEITICTFAVGVDNPRVLVRGDAVVVRLADADAGASASSGRRLADFPLDAYKRLWGVFLHVLPNGGDGETESLGIVVPADTDMQLLQDMVRQLRGGEASNAAAVESMRKLFKLSGCEA